MRNEMKKQEILNIFAILNQMESINRFSRDRLVNEENVLQHTGWVCVWSYFVAVQIQQHYSVKLDFEKIFRGAVTHDMEEISTGDIPRVTKYASKEIREAIEKWENTSILKIEQVLNNDCLHKDWSNAKGNKTIEQYIVKIADIAAVICKLWDEVVRLNNYSMLRVAGELQFVIDAERKKDIPIENEEIILFFERLNTSLYCIVQEIIAIPNNKQLVHTLNYGD